MIIILGIAAGRVLAILLRTQEIPGSNFDQQRGCEKYIFVVYITPSDQLWKKLK